MSMETTWSNSPCAGMVNGHARSKEALFAWLTNGALRRGRGGVARTWSAERRLAAGARADALSGALRQTRSSSSPVSSCRLLRAKLFGLHFQYCTTFQYYFPVLYYYFQYCSYCVSSVQVIFSLQEATQQRLTTHCFHLEPTVRRKKFLVIIHPSSSFFLPILAY